MGFGNNYIGLWWIRQWLLRRIVYGHIVILVLLIWVCMRNYKRPDLLAIGSMSGVRGV
jgi:hypothetical protein